MYAQPITEEIHRFKKYRYLNAEFKVKGLRVRPEASLHKPRMREDDRTVIRITPIIGAFALYFLEQLSLCLGGGSL